MPLEALLASLRPGGRDFEHLCKWMLENVPEYQRRLKRVWLWDEWPLAGSRDIGIDLVTEDHEGGLWAIQVKHYDPAYAIKKADLDSFLSASSRAEFTYRLMIATTDHLGPNARSTIAIQEKPVGVLLRSQLEAMEIAWPTSTVRLRPTKPKRKRPRPHQRLAINDCVQGLATADRGQLVMACGTGKTLVAPFLAERMAAKRLLVLVPSLSLLGQTLREWATTTDFDYLAVCSDDTVTKDEHDAVVASTSELGVPVTTDAVRISRFLRKRGQRTKVIFSTYQSSPQIAAAQTGGVPAFDLVIADEAHRCAGPQAGVFATVLDPTKIKARKRLFMTATPRYFTGRVKREASEADWEVASMDEEAKFGPVMHRLTFGQAIEQDLLSDYRVVVVGVTDDEAFDLAARGAFVTHDGHAVTDARTLSRQIGLLRAMAKHDLRRIVTFHSRIEYATRFASSLRETSAWLPARRRPSGDLWTDHVSGKMTAGERDARLRTLSRVGADERGVLANARCLTEGVDVPTLDGVAFIDPRRSQVDVVQAVGRAIRKAEDKALGYIVIPVLVDADSDPGEAVEASEFDRVWEVLRGLRDHDDDLADELDALRREQGRRGSVSERPRKVVLDLPTRIGRSFASAFDARLVETTTRGWEFKFGMLERFVSREGHCLVPKEHMESGVALGSWVGVQRRWHASAKLSPSRAERLAAIPGWVWNTREDAWERGFCVLSQFAEREGHTSLSTDWMENGYRLGQWVGAQRGRRDAMSDERRRRLEAMPGWSWDLRESNWDRAYRTLVSFAAREGHARPAIRHQEDGVRLGRWVNVQRTQFGKRQLRADRVAALESLRGWVWDVNEADWETGFDALAAFVEREGHADVQYGHVEGGYPLGTWVTAIRTDGKAGRLAATRVARLESMPGWVWSRHEDRWERMYDRAQRLSEAGESDGSEAEAVRRWLTKQRTAYRSGRLSRERQEKLEQLPGFSWTAHEDRRARMYALLLTFASREGHALVPQGHIEDGERLGSWVNSQRTKFRDGALDPDWMARLQAVEGWSWSAARWAGQWARSFDMLRRHAGRTGSALVRDDEVIDGVQIGPWARKQRSLHKSGSLSAERARQLAELPGWTWTVQDDKWTRAYRLLQSYAEREGTARVTDNTFVDGFNLSYWARKQRSLYRSGDLSEERTRVLEALSGWRWDDLRGDRLPRRPRATA